MAGRPGREGVGGRRAGRAAGVDEQRGLRAGGSVARCARGPRCPRAAGPLAFRWAIADSPYSREWAWTLYRITARQYATPGRIVTEAMRVPQRYLRECSDGRS